MDVELFPEQNDGPVKNIGRPEFTPGCNQYLLNLILHSNILMSHKNICLVLFRFAGFVVDHD